MSVKHPNDTGARWCALWLPLSCAFLLPACLVDLDQRCGKNQHYAADTANCVCDGDYALQGNSCVRCGENEVGSADGCVCVDGFSRATPDAACEALAGLGQDCARDADCGDERYGFCRLEADSSAGYCTAPDCS